MRGTYKVIWIFTFAALFSAPHVDAQGTDQQAEEPQEADFGMLYRRGGGVDEQTIRDMQAQGAIYKTLLEETDIDPGPIHVQVENGAVILTGQVSTQQARETVTDVARDARYVDSVTNKLEIDNHS